MPEQWRILINGVVQGVGFRPLCARLASMMGIGGSVLNSSDGVLLTLRATESQVEAYLKLLKDQCPDVAFIHKIEILGSDLLKDQLNPGVFTIEPSLRRQTQRVLLPPDMATCEDCLADVKDGSDRRYGYPFTNCTNCGPRFTIVEKLPYDRQSTVMRSFEMCGDCRLEYENPSDRRFHAQPTACEKCGPSLWFTDRNGVELSRDGRALDDAVQALSDGRIIAVKGLGGFHLACLPRDESVRELRRRKNRPWKPFALMARSLDEARRIVEIDAHAEKLLCGMRAPIVLLRDVRSPLISSAVASGLSRLGVMLPYTPLHHMLLEKFPFLVMTSANVSGEALIGNNEEALSKLGNVCDYFLMHDRTIHMKLDDSLIMPTSAGDVILRRARGFVPNPVIMDEPCEISALAAGAEMKGSFAISQEEMIFPSQFLGDLKELSNGEYYEKSLKHFMALYDLNPRVLVVDRHPQFTSSEFARKATGGVLPELSVQHHFAHLGAVMAEYSRTGATLGLIFDGTGLGDDGTVWGGEFLICCLESDNSGFDRVGHILPFKVIGGDRAILEPWRSGLGLLMEVMPEEEVLELAEALWPESFDVIKTLIAGWGNIAALTAATSSCGRLFDGMAALFGSFGVVSCDSEAPMRFEAMASLQSLSEGEITEIHSLDSVIETDGMFLLDWRAFLKYCLERGYTGPKASTAFHVWLSGAAVCVADFVEKRYGIRHVVLSGGVWQNATLLEMTCERLKDKGLEVLLHKQLSPNDECVAVGQVFIALKTL